MAREKKTSKFGNNKFKSSQSTNTRKANTRDERPVKDELPKITINFKDFNRNQCPPGQDYSDWENDKLLSELLKKFEVICSYNLLEARQQGLIKIYGDFPANSEFTIPDYIEGEVKWGTIQRIGGQKPRLAGYFINSTFYPVFLDKEHKFYPSTRK